MPSLKEQPHSRGGCLKPRDRGREKWVTRPKLTPANQRGLERQDNRGIKLVPWCRKAGLTDHFFIHVGKSFNPETEQQGKKILYSCDIQLMPDINRKAWCYLKQTRHCTQVTSLGPQEARGPSSQTFLANGRTSRVPLAVAHDTNLGVFPLLCESPRSTHCPQSPSAFWNAICPF